jgi:hypothetical protein
MFLHRFSRSEEFFGNLLHVNVKNCPLVSRRRNGTFFYKLLLKALFHSDVGAGMFR